MNPDAFLPVNRKQTSYKKYFTIAGISLAVSVAVICVNNYNCPHSSHLAYIAKSATASTARLTPKNLLLATDVNSGFAVKKIGTINYVTITKDDANAALVPTPVADAGVIRVRPQNVDNIFEAANEPWGNKCEFSQKSLKIGTETTESNYLTLTCSDKAVAATTAEKDEANKQTFDQNNFHSLWQTVPVTTTKLDAAADAAAAKAALIPSTIKDTDGKTPLAFHYHTYKVAAVAKVPAVEASKEGVTPKVEAKAEVPAVPEAIHLIVTLGANASFIAMSFATLLISASFL